MTFAEDWFTNPKGIPSGNLRQNYSEKATYEQRELALDPMSCQTSSHFSSIISSSIIS